MVKEACKSIKYGIITKGEAKAHLMGMLHYGCWKKDRVIREDRDIEKKGRKTLEIIYYSLVRNQFQWHTIGSKS